MDVRIQGSPSRTDFEEKVKFSRENFYSFGNEWFIFRCKS